MRPSLRYRAGAAVAAVVVITAGATAQTSGLLSRFDAATDWGKFTKLFQPFRVHTGRTVDVGADGVVLSAPAVKSAGPFGMQAERTLVGDFQLDLKYDLLEFPHHPLDAGYGLVVGLSCDAGPKYGSVKTGRSVYMARPPSYHAQRSTPVGGDQTQHASAHTPTLAKQGRLGLRRVGTEAVFLASDTPDGELQEWTRYPFTDRPVRVITLYADTGGATEGMKARLYDLQLRTGAELPPAPKASDRTVGTISRLPPEAAALAQASTAGTDEPVPSAPDDPGAEPARSPPVRGGWWLPVATFAAGVVVGLTAGRLRRGPSAAPTRPSEPRPPAPKPAVPRPPVTAAKPTADTPRSPAV